MAEKTPNSTEPQLDKIREAAALYPEVRLTIRRRDRINGKIASLPNMMARTADLADGTLEENLRARYGGGSYLIYAVNPANTMEQVIPTYNTEIEGPPLTQQQAAANVPAMLGGRPAAAAPQMYYPGVQFASFVPADDRPPSTIDPSLFMSMPPDQMAREMGARMEAMLAERLKESAAATARLEKELKETQAETVREREKREEERRQHEKEIHRQEMDALRQQIAGGNGHKPTFDFGEIAKLVAAGVPVLTALITSRSGREEAVLKLQQDNSRAQLDGIKELVRAQFDRTGGVDKTIESLVKVVPLFVPVLKIWLEERSPTKTAELVSALAENNLTTLNMVGQFMNNFAEEQPQSMWAQLAKQAIQGVQEIASQMTVDARKRPALQQPQQRPVVTQIPQTPQEWADAIVGSPNTPQEFKTPKWHELWRMIHDPNVPAQQVTDELGTHLDELQGTPAMPEVFRTLHSDEETLPSVFLGQLLSQLPLSQNDPARVKALCEAIDVSFTATGAEPIVTPPPVEHTAHVVS